MGRKLLFRLGIAGVAAASVAITWAIKGPDIPDRDFTGLSGDVNRGAYVARLSGCIACHTDIKGGGAILAGGAELKTAFGSFYPPNVTPHQQDGIGSWSLNDFSKSLTAGKSPDGTHYFPAFPYEFYKNMSDQDIVDLWAAVNSVPPVAGKSPPHEMRFPFGFRPLVGIWQNLFFNTDRLVSGKSQSAQWNRGQYLAEGPAHCAACHTPRNLLGGRIDGAEYTGGIGVGGEKIPAVTPEYLLKHNWTEDDLAYGLQTGLKPDGDLFGGTMAEVVKDGTSYWSNDDLKALSNYLFNPVTNK